MEFLKRTDRTPRKRPSTEETPFQRNDPDFIAQVDNLRRMKAFLIQSGAKLKDEDRAILATNAYLNSLKYNRNAADPTNEEWRNLDATRFALSAYLTGDLLTRFQLRLAPKFLFYLPVIFAAAIVFFLCIMYLPPTWSFGTWLFNKPVPGDPNEIPSAWFLVGVIGWTIGLGGLGAIVSLYINAMSIEIDRTVDVSDPGFVLMRIIIGCLFGFVLGLSTILPHAGDRPWEWLQKSGDTKDATVYLISPFVFGFSTPLVISVMNRMIETIQGFMGMQPKRPVEAAGSPAAPPAPPPPRSGETNQPNG
jgi:hypothetical protein